jgi:hypothetical protein
MANSYSTQDVIKGALQRVGEKTDGSSPYHQLALKYVNKVHSAIIKGNSEFTPEVRQAWSWARKTTNVIIPGFYQTGTVALTTGVNTGTFSTPPTVSVQGYFLRVIGQPTFYTIASHTASSANFTIDSVYLEPTGTALAFGALPLILNLGAGIMRIVSPLRIYVNRVLEFNESAADMGEVALTDPIPFWETYPLQLVQNDTPSKAAIIYRSETVFQVQLNKYPTNPLRTDFDYIPIPQDLVDSSTSYPLLPRDDRDALETGAGYYLFLDKKQQPDADNYFKLTANKINSMALLEQSTQKFSGRAYGNIIPRLDDTAIPYWVITR